MFSVSVQGQHVASLVLMRLLRLYSLTSHELPITVTTTLLSDSQLQETLTTRDREINSLRRQLDASHKELDDVGKSREISFKENRRLQDDLATMARENQV